MEQIKKNNILIIDDNKSDLEIYSIALSRIEAETGTPIAKIFCSSLTELEQKNINFKDYSLIISDFWLGNASAENIIGYIKENCDTPPPIHVYSNSSYEKDMQLSFDAGAQAYVVKPQKIGGLIHSLKKSLAAGKTS